MDSPSSVYSETSPPTPIPAFALPPPLFPSANYSSEPLGMMGKRSFENVGWGDGFSSWGAEKQVLKSMVTDDEFIMGSPRDSLLCRRRHWNRKTDKGRHCNPGNWQGSVDNQIRHNAKMDLNKTWREERGEPLHRPSMFRAIDWNASATFREVSVSPCTVPVSPASTPPTGHQTFSKASAPHVPAAGPTVSTYSLARFVDREAPGFFELTSSTASQSFSSDDSFIEDAVIEQATLAIPLAVPPRGSSLLNLRVLQAGAASRARRPVLDDISESEGEGSSFTTHHSNLVPTTLELGIATAHALSLSNTELSL
ncbi:hypothetical protein PRZ48_014748 [Zasmidium cellare]|uniref:Uncharacterized protein n=1 Tax=Zasmidium cellare TaxID=395010 RepID=A0ABR0DZ82_ZASCE|nr:hypothetical protein PRZ48_014748 [Zasmidium cellare]